MYGSANNVKHGEMEDSFMNFTPAMAACDAAFIEMNGTKRKPVYTIKAAGGSDPGNPSRAMQPHGRGSKANH